MRKRKRHANEPSSSKRVKVLSSHPATGDAQHQTVCHNVLSSYYSRVYTLRHFFVDALPSSTSRARRRKIATYVLRDGSGFLDDTLVGILEQAKPDVKEARHRDFLAFTQSQQRQSLGSCGTPEEDRLVEIVDFVIWSLLQRRGSGASNTPSNVLCHRVQETPLGPRAFQNKPNGTEYPAAVPFYAEDASRKFKGKPWVEILPLLGSNGEAILCHLLFDCGVFGPLDHGKDNLHQICGIPVFDLLPDRRELYRHPKPITDRSPRNPRGSLLQPRTPGSINFVRSRILHARPSLNARGVVRFGMKHIHVLNRHPDLHNELLTIHILKHIFPLQYGLHNVFTSIVDKSETAQEFKDYTLREQEISCAVNRAGKKIRGGIQAKGTMVPRRLRGEPLRMTKAIRSRHSKCSYTQLLRHHCPVRSNRPQILTRAPASTEQPSTDRLETQLSCLDPDFSPGTTPNDGSNLGEACGSTLQYVTPTAQASAFCRAVLRRLLPAWSLGTGTDGEHNWEVVLRRVDQFVRMRRHESFTLHHMFQDLKIQCVSWLRPPQFPSSAGLSQSDRSKRVELFLEFLYYVFDSILIPLIRSHFYVTDSNIHRNHLFYFRHDVWRTVSEPSLTNLRMTMFQGLSEWDLGLHRRSRLLGHSQIRLLPKGVGIRPIINLRRKGMKTINGKTVLGHNINSKLMPCFAVLNYEKHLQPDRLGSALFSIGEAHERLREFQDLARKSGSDSFYLVKMDVKSCFDTIPQDEVMNVARQLLSEHRYQIDKHAELKASGGKGVSGDFNNRPVLRFVQKARPWPSTTPPSHSDPGLSHQAHKRNGTVFVDLAKSRTWKTTSLLDLLQEHVQRNVVTIGKRFFKQKQGIPQGSVLSSLLCNFFYGSFENEHLGFLHGGGSLLLRVIDDFLLITTNRDHARRFTQVMMDGSPKHGIAVHPGKSLANFELVINGTKLPRLHGSNMFPYCGMAIDVKTLEVSKYLGGKDPLVSNGLTVDFSHRQGLKFRKKVLDSVRLQMAAMLLDTSLNGQLRVMSNLYQCFMEAAMKMYRYTKELPKKHRPRDGLLKETWQDLITLAARLTRGKRSNKSVDEYECSVSATQIRWLAAAALDDVVSRKQTDYQAVLPWLHSTMEQCQAKMNMNAGQLLEIRRQGRRVFERFRY